MRVAVISASVIEGNDIKTVCVPNVMTLFRSAVFYLLLLAWSAWVKTNEGNIATLPSQAPSMVL